MKKVVILGAGFAGLQLATRLSEDVPSEVDVTIIDKSDAFVFGFSKLDLMYGRADLDAVRLPYSRIDKPSVRFVRETILSIDPANRRPPSVDMAEGGTVQTGVEGGREQSGRR